jgi:hypothetical protein
LAFSENFNVKGEQHVFTAFARDNVERKRHKWKGMGNKLMREISPLKLITTFLHMLPHKNA